MRSTGAAFCFSNLLTKASDSRTGQWEQEQNLIFFNFFNRCILPELRKLTKQEVAFSSFLVRTNCTVRMIELSERAVTVGEGSC